MVERECGSSITTTARWTQKQFCKVTQARQQYLRKNFAKEWARYSVRKYPKHIHTVKNICTFTVNTYQVSEVNRYISEFGTSLTFREHREYHLHIRDRIVFHYWGNGSIQNPCTWNRGPKAKQTPGGRTNAQRQNRHLKVKQTPEGEVHALWSCTAGQHINRQVLGQWTNYHCNTLPRILLTAAPRLERYSLATCYLFKTCLKPNSNSNPDNFFSFSTWSTHNYGNTTTYWS